MPNWENLMLERLTKNKRAILYLKYLVALVILIAIFQVIPITDVLKALKSANLSYIAIAYIIIISTRYLSAYRIKILTDVHKIKTSVQQLFELNLITSMYSLFLPGTLAGGAVRWYKLSQISNKPAQSLAAIIYDRLMSTLGFTMMGTIFWLLENRTQNDNEMGGVLILTTSILLLSYLLAFNKIAGDFILKIIDRLIFAPSVIRDKLKKLVNSSMEYRTISEWKHIEIFITTILFEASGIFAVYLLALSLEIPISIIQIGWIRSIILLISMLPISFAGIGVRDGGLILLLGLYNVAPSDAVALSFLILISNFVLALCGGIFELRNTFIRTPATGESTNIDTRNRL